MTSLSHRELNQQRTEPTLQSVIEKNIFEEVNFQFVEIYRTKTQKGHNFHSSPTPGSKYLNRLKATNSSTSYPKKLE